MFLDMLEQLSPTWLMILGAVIFAIAIYLYLQIREWLGEVLKPFKKGKHYYCKVIAVSDGDTITCQRLNLRRSQTKIRFAYIDAPESSQSYGPEAQRIVKTLIYKKIVRIHITDTDRYGRHVGEIFRFRRSINEELVRRGGAWVYEDYIRDQKRLKHLMSLQASAKQNKKGLWKSARPIKPSVYRKQK